MADSDAYKLWLASPYGQVHQQAEKAKQNYEPQYWHNNPYKILDTEDIYHIDTGTMRRRKSVIASANNIFKSSWNMRSIINVDIENPPTPQEGLDVERDAIVNILDNSLALRGYRSSRHFTYKQKQAMVLEREALRLGETPTIFISEQLGIHRSNAWRRLNKAKSATLGHENDIIVLERQAKKELGRTCCYCGNPTQNGLRALCDACDKRFYYLEDYPINFSPDDLKRLINVSNAEHWQRVRKNAA